MKHFYFFLFILTPFLLEAQLWSEDFEGSNTTNPAVFEMGMIMGCAADNNDYFGLVCANGGSCDNPISSGFALTGNTTTFFGVRDMDSTPCGTDVDLAGETLSFSAIDISSCGGSNILYVCFTAAESRNMGDAAGSEWGTTNMREDTWDGSSFMFVQSSIDGSALSDVTSVQAVNNSDSRPGIDVNCDGKADDPGEPELTDNFTSYCFELPSFGSTLDLEFTFGELNSGGEDIHIDDIEVHCTDNPASLPGTLLAACTPFEDNTCFWKEDFNGSNTTNPTVIDPGCSIVNSRDYFGVVCLDGGPCGSADINSDYDYLDTENSFFGARDTDNACGGTPFGTLSASGIDISGCSAQLYLCFSIAESSGAAENSNDGSFDSWDGNSQVTVYTTFSDGRELALTDIQSTDGSNSVPGFDTDCNIGSAGGPAITNSFTTYCFAMLPDGAASVDIVFEINGLNTDGEDIAIDNISLCCTNTPASLPGTVLTSCNITRAALPVELTYFKGETLAKGASLLSWETSQEINNDYFVLEYSTDGEAFTSLAQVMGAESNNTPTQYTYEHESPLGELNYYRLKQVDFDGTYSYSDIVVLHKENAPYESKIYPNPSSEELVYEGIGATLTIYDSYGKRLKQIEAQVGTQRIDIRDLRPGYYVLEVVKSDETREVRRFIKM